MYLVGVEAEDLDYLLTQGTHVKASDQMVACRACQSGRLQNPDGSCGMSYGQS